MTTGRINQVTNVRQTPREELLFAAARRTLSPQSSLSLSLFALLTHKKKKKGKNHDYTRLKEASIGPYPLQLEVIPKTFLGQSTFTQLKL
jgi:hypothetical protein